jgi:hypothetical protein
MPSGFEYLLYIFPINKLAILAKESLKHSCPLNNRWQKTAGTVYVRHPVSCCLCLYPERQHIKRNRYLERKKARNMQKNGSKSKNEYSKMQPWGPSMEC